MTIVANESSAIHQANYYIGLMSGTSADGIDLVLVDFSSHNTPKVMASFYQAYDDITAKKITNLYNPDHNEIDRAFALDKELATLFAKAINLFLQQEHLTSADIIAIGNHGQTIRHRPQIDYPFTLQIGCCQTLATQTNIRVIGQFRQKDMALGGQGAPLVPAFHDKIFRETNRPDASDVFVVNIGGIANLTYLPTDNLLDVIGYDSGPGNALMDDWFCLHNPHSNRKYDDNGQWAANGTINETLLKRLYNDKYFQRSAPKSTGREYFNVTWLKSYLDKFQQTTLSTISAEDIQATLTALTALSIANEVKKQSKSRTSSNKVYLCGGGAHNKTLKNQLNHQLNSNTQKYKILLTNQKDIDGDQLEAIAFAWLAYAYDKKLLSSMSAVTGASKSCTLGTAFFP